MSGAEVALLLPALEGAAAAGTAAAAPAALAGAGTALGTAAAFAPEAGLAAGLMGSVAPEIGVGSAMAGFGAPAAAFGAGGGVGLGSEAMASLFPGLAAGSANAVGGALSDAAGLAGAPGAANPLSVGYGNMMSMNPWIDKALSGVGKAANTMGGVKMGMGLLGADQQRAPVAPMQRPQQQDPGTMMGLLSARGLSGVPSPDAKASFAIKARQMGLSPDELMRRMQGRMV